LSQGTLQHREQDVSKRCYFGMWQRPEGAGIVSWSSTAAQISALVRALDFGPYPNALGRSKVAIGDEFMVCPEVEVLGRTNGAVPGTITAIEPGRIRIAAKDSEVGIARLLTLPG